MSAGSIKIALIIINVASGGFGNSTFGVPTPSQQQANDQYVIDSINASGGVACRKLEPVFVDGDPVDETSLQQACLTVVGDKVFFAVDPGAYDLYPQLSACYAQNQIPFFSFALIPRQLQTEFYPYIFAQGLLEPIYRNMVFGLAQRGFFSPANGFHKEGVIYRDCSAQLPGEILAWMHQAGLSSGQIVTYDVGCPTSFASPGNIEQAVLQFKTQGVTNVTEVEDNIDFSNFTTIAQQQRFNPKYGIANDAAIPVTYTNTHPDYQNLANSIAIVQDRWGEERTLGVAPSAGTVKCNAIFTAHGEPPVWQQSDGTGGDDCDELWFFQAAADHAPALQRTDLAAGLQAARSIDLSFPFGPVDFSIPQTTYGSQFWRVAQFFTSCDCWRLIDPTFHQAFP